MLHASMYHDLNQQAARVPEREVFFFTSLDLHVTC